MIRLTFIATIAIAFSFVSCDSKENPDENDSAGSNDSQAGTSKQEEIANKIMDSMNEFATAINNISNAKTAKEAVIKTNEIKGRFSTYAEELKELDPLAEESRRAISQKMEVREAQMKNVFGPAFLKTMQSMRQEEQKLIEKSFKAFHETMESVGPEFDRHFKIEN